MKEDYKIELDPYGEENWDDNVREGYIDPNKFWQIRTLTIIPESDKEINYVMPDEASFIHKVILPNQRMFTGFVAMNTKTKVLSGGDDKIKKGDEIKIEYRVYDYVRP